MGKNNKDDWKKSQEYWEDRIIKGRKKADKINDTFTKRQRRMYKKSYKTILNYLNDLLVDIEQGEQITRTQLYTAKKYIKLLEVIDKSATSIHNKQVKDLEKAINDVYNNVIGEPPLELERGPYTKLQFNKPFKHQEKQVLNTYWLGDSFKGRAGKNAKQFAGRVKDKITDAIVLGKNPDLIKKELMKEFDIAFNVADRLVRTETAYAFNQASINQYKDEGIQKVKILLGHTPCDTCKDFENKVYVLGVEEPFLPAHPNCTCCYVPIVDIGRKAETK